MALDAVFRNDDDLAVLDLSNETRADNIERAGFRSENECVAELTDDQRTDAEWVTDANKLFVCCANEGIGAVDFTERVDKASYEAARAVAAPRDEMDDDFCIGGRLEDRAGRDKLAPQFQCVGEIAIMGQREAAGVEIGEEGLHISERRLADGRVAHMSNGCGATQMIDNRLAAKMVAHKAEPPFRVKLCAVKAHNACGFLPSMLQSMKAECG